MKKKLIKSRGFVIPLLLGIIALMLVGGGAYIYGLKKVEPLVSTNIVESPQDVVDLNTNDSISETATTSTSELWNKYTDQEYGFSFYYPKTWKLTNDDNGLILSHFGPTKNDPAQEQDSISIRRHEGNSVTVQDAKFGNTLLYYDQSSTSLVAANDKWIQTMDDDMNVSSANPHAAVPSFYTISNLPVFPSTGRWETKIVPLSHQKFLIINITGSGWTKALDPFTKTIIKSSDVVSTQKINAAVQEEINAESLEY